MEKLIDEILKKQLLKYFEGNYIIPKGNHGGRAAFSTLTRRSVKEKHTANNIEDKDESILLASNLEMCLIWMTTAC